MKFLENNVLKTKSLNLYQHLSFQYIHPKSLSKLLSDQRHRERDSVPATLPSTECLLKDASVFQPHELFCLSLLETASVETLRSPISAHEPQGQRLEQDIQKVPWEQKKEHIQNSMFCHPGVFLKPRNYKTDFHSAYF